MKTPLHTKIIGSLCLLCWALFSPTFAQAQTHPEDLLLRPSGLMRVELAAGQQTALASQIGDHNSIDVHQLQQGAAEANMIRAWQEGNNNLAQIEQIGVGNQANLIQEGNNNSYVLLQNGQGNTSFVLQQGNDNQIVQELINSDHTNTEFIQQGNDNVIIHQANGAVARDFQIIQQGNGQTAILKQSGN